MASIPHSEKSDVCLWCRQLSGASQPFLTRNLGSTGCSNWWGQASNTVAVVPSQGGCKEGRQRAGEGAMRGERLGTQRYMCPWVLYMCPLGHSHLKHPIYAHLLNSRLEPCEARLHHLVHARMHEFCCTSIPSCTLETGFAPPHHHSCYIVAHGLEIYPLVSVKVQDQDQGRGASHAMP